VGPRGERAGQPVVDQGVHAVGLDGVGALLVGLAQRRLEPADPADEDEVVDELGPADGELLGDEAAHRVADEGDRGQLEGGDQRGDVIGVGADRHLAVAEARCGRARAGPWRRRGGAARGSR
jgi:hypothetical protein